MTSVLFLILLLSFWSCSKEETLTTTSKAETRSTITTNPVESYLSHVELIRKIVTDSQSLYTNQIYDLDSSITSIEGLLNMYGADGIQEFQIFDIIKDSLTVTNVNNITGSEIKSVFSTLSNSLRTQFNTLLIPNKKITHFDFEVIESSNNQSKIMASAQVVSSSSTEYPTSLNYNCSTHFSENECYVSGCPDLDDGGILYVGGECNENSSENNTNAQEEIQKALQGKIAKSGLYYIYSRTNKYPTKVEVRVNFMDVSEPIIYEYNQLNDILFYGDISTEYCDDQDYIDGGNEPLIKHQYDETLLSCNTCLLESIIDLEVPANRSVSYINVYGLGLPKGGNRLEIHWFLKLKHGIPMITFSKTPNSNEDLGSTPFSTKPSFMMILNNNTTDEVYIDDIEFSSL